MVQEIEILVEPREIKTKGYLKQMRQKGYIPAVAYGAKVKPTNLWVKYKTLNDLITKIASIEGTVFNIKIKDKEYPVIIKEIQRDPVTDKPIHVDFQVISLKEKIEVKVPVRLVGEETVLRLTGGMIDFPVRELRVKCLPKDIPEYIEIDISNLKIGQAITVKDIPQEKFVILDPPETLVVHILSKKVEEVVPTEVTTAAPQEPEVISRGKKEKEETPSTGEDKK